MKRSKNRLAECLKCRYPVQVCECEGGGYFVKIPDLPGCMSQGRTVEEALANIREAKELWLAGALECGMEIPKPAEPRRYSGDVVLRMSGSLHRRLSRAAEREGVSLNQYIVARLSPKRRRAGRAAGSSST